MRRPPILWVHDLLGVRVGVLHRCFNIELDTRLGESEALTFTVAAADPQADLLVEDCMIQYGSRHFTVTRMEQTREGPRAVIRVECEATWMRLAEVRKIGDFTLLEYRVDQGLDAILDGSGWSRGACDSVLEYNLDRADASVLELVREWARIAGLEVAFSTGTRQVSLLTQVGADLGVTFRYGRNLTNVVRRSEPPQCTKLYYFGRNGLTMSASHPDGDEFVTDYSFYTTRGLSLAEAEASYTKVLTLRDDSFTQASALYAAALVKIAEYSQPVVAYEMQAVDLASITGYPDDQFTVGDTVQVRDAGLGIDPVSLRVVRTVRRPLEPQRTDVELAYLPNLYGDLTSGGRGGGEGAEWMLVKHTSSVTRTVTTATTILDYIGVDFIEDGEAVLGAQVSMASGSGGSLDVQLWDEDDNVRIGPPCRVAAGTNATAVLSWPLTGLSGRYYFSVRAAMTAGSCSVTAGDSSMWALVKGGLGVSVERANEAIFEYTGSAQTWTVPAGVTSVRMDVYGAGGKMRKRSLVPGYGGRVLASVPVTPGETLQINVGQWPTGVQPNGGWNGGGGGNGSSAGGGGGGASDVRRGAYGLTDRLVVAGGGGGTSGWSSPNGAGGGNGGGTTGAAGSGVLGGGGGTQSAGGAGGGDGTAGSFGQGGTGGNVSGPRGGGGGGGYYGGGGGGGFGGPGLIGGGGGGSSYLAPSATLTLTEQGVNPGHGVVIFTWDNTIV